MKYKFYTSLLFICFLSVNSFSQELDEAFLSSLPEGVASDLMNRTAERDALEETQYRRPSTFINKPDPTSDRFGAKIFSMMQSSLMPLNEPNFDGLYRLDFGDELQIQLIGQKSSIDKVQINRDGSINIKDIGKSYIAGLTLDEATTLIKAIIKESYIGVQSFVTLTNVRDIQVIMAGNVYNPGSYTLNGNSNLFHALSVSGGPSELGSFRSIDLIRGNQKIETVDLYQTFIFGKSSFNNRLRSGDMIFINPVNKILSISGAVMRPGSYELKDDEYLSTLIEFGNGLNALADLNSIKLERILDGRIKSLLISNISQFKNIKAQKGDNVYIRSFPFRTVEIRGAVMNPGSYAMNAGDTLNDIIIKSGGLTKNAYPFGATYESLEAKEINKKALEKLYVDSLDNILQLIKSSGADANFDPLINILGQLKDIEPNGRLMVDIKNESKSNLMLLKAGDIITIPEKSNQVFVYGAVSSDGAVEYAAGEPFDYFIKKMGGFKENAKKNGIYIFHPNGETMNIGMNKNIFANRANKIDIYPGSIIYVPEKIDNGYTQRLTTSAYAAILGDLGVTLASLSVLKD